MELTPSALYRRLREAYSADPYVSRRVEWRLSARPDRARSAMVGQFGPPSSESPDSWHRERWLGLFDATWTIDEAANRLRWETHPKPGPLGIVLLAAAGYLLWAVNVAFIPILSGGEGANITIQSIAAIVILAVLLRGPSPEQPPPVIAGRRSTDTTLEMVLGIVVAVLLPVAVLAALQGQVLFTLLFAIIATTAGLYLYGESATSIPTRLVDGGWDTPVQPQVKIVALVLFPALFSFGLLVEVLTIQSTLVGHPNPGLVLASRTALVVGATVGYSYLCFRVVRTLSSRRFSPYRSQIGRVAIIGSYLAVVLLLLGVVQLSVGATLTYAGPIGFDIRYDVAGLALMGTIGGGLLALGVASAMLDGVRVSRSEAATGLLPSALGVGVAIIGHLALVLLALFVGLVSADLFLNFVTSDAPLYDPSPRTLRQALDLRLAISDAFAALGLPGEPASRLYLVATLVFLTPLIVPVGSWAHHLYDELRGSVVIRSLVRSGDDELLADGVRSFVAEKSGGSVEVRVVRTTAPLLPVPVTRLRGSSLVLVGESVVESFGKDTDALTAIIAHELYHLQNRDLFVNLAATFSSVAFGGRNALLAFYDYPSREREADEYAIEQVGAIALSRGLERASQLQESSSTGRRANRPEAVLADAAGPGLLHSESIATPSLSTGAVLKRLRTVLSAPFQLFFGSILFDLSHERLRDRKNRIQLGPRYVTSFVSDHQGSWSVAGRPGCEVEYAVPREAIVEHFVARGADSTGPFGQLYIDEGEVQRAIDRLCEKGKLVESRRNRYRVRGSG